MTSKEALESIRNEYYTENGEKIVVIGRDDERFDVVEKDLEVLEEIEKLYNIYNTTDTSEQIIIGNIFAILEERLENDK